MKLAISKKCLYIFLIMAFFCFLNAEDFVLKKGQSRVFSTNANITTVFTSDQKVVDYKIVNNNKIIVYALGNGYSNIKIFGGNNSNLLLSLDITVDPMAGELERIQNEIMEANPGTTIEIKRLSEPGKRGYVLIGEVPDDGTRDYVYNMAALSLGLKGSGGGGGDDAGIEGGGENSGAGGAEGGGGAEGAAGGAGGGGGGSGGGSSGGNVKASGRAYFLQQLQLDTLIDKMVVKSNNQVNVKLIVADIDKELTEQLGIDWNKGVFVLPDLLQLGGLTLAAPNIPSAAAATFADATSGGGGGATPSIIPIIRALKNDKVAKILAQPNLSVLSGEVASFSIQNEYTTFEEKAGGNGIVGSIAISRGPTVRPGLKLSIAPKIFNKNRIRIKINQNVSNIYRFDQKGETTIADLRTRSTESTIELGDGDSFVIGGLTDEKDIETIASVPFLGDIPFLGAIFRSSSISKQKSELIIIATVSITQPKKNGSTYSLPTFKTRSLGESLINVTFNKGADVDKDIKSFINNIGFVR